mgnify:CR=1 FL=1
MSNIGWIGAWGVFIIGFAAFCLRVNDSKLSWDHVLTFAIVLALLIAVLFPGIYNPRLWGL